MTNKELDKWIAENVMGWKREKRYGTPPYGIFYWVDESLSYKWIRPVDGWESWHPTTSISDAFMVVEKMRGKCYFFECIGYSDGWRVRVRRSGQGFVNELNKSLPLCLCLAAKKAVEGEGE